MEKSPKALRVVLRKVPRNVNKWFATHIKKICTKGNKRLLRQEAASRGAGQGSQLATLKAKLVKISLGNLRFLFPLLLATKISFYDLSQRCQLKVAQKHAANYAAAPAAASSSGGTFLIRLCGRVPQRGREWERETAKAGWGESVGVAQHISPDK